MSFMNYLSLLAAEMFYLGDVLLGVERIHLLVDLFDVIGYQNSSETGNDVRDETILTSISAVVLVVNQMKM